MSERIWRFFLNELATIRIHCQACSGVIEWPIEKARSSFAQKNHCPLCLEEFGGPDNGPPPLHELAKAMEWLKRTEDRVKVEFILPDETPT